MIKECKCCPEDEIGLVILRTATIVRRAADTNSHMNELHKITGQNGWILQYLEDHRDEDIYQKDLEEKFSTTRSTISKVIKGMETKGLLRRESVLSDARLKKLVLTEEGRRICHGAEGERDALENRIKKGFTEAELETLKALLGRIDRNLLGCDRKDGECR